MERSRFYPFVALVGQDDLKLALLLALINPAIGGVLLEGPYGVGKTTAVRALIDLMPPVSRSVCRRGCLPDDETICPECRERLSRGEPLVITEPMRLIELPLNARLEDVVGGMNERVALEQRRVLLEPGVLAVAHGNVLYVDEVNLLDAAVVDAILDAAAQGRTFVRRGAMVRLYESRFVLIGSMNPEEGRLRPQILDRFGLRVWVAPLDDPEARLTALRRARAFAADPLTLRERHAAETARLAQAVARARESLPNVQPTEDAERMAVEVVRELGIPSHRAEIVLLEAARALAAFDDRAVAGVEDITRIAPLALRHRRSAAINSEAERVAQEDRSIRDVMSRVAAGVRHAAR